MVRCGDFARTGGVEWGTGNPPGTSAPGGADEEGWAIVKALVEGVVGMIQRQFRGNC